MTVHQQVQEDRRLLSIPHAAEFLGISVRTLRCLIAKADLPLIRVSPGRVMVDRRDLEKYIEDRRGS